MAGHIASSDRTDWCTPKHIVDAVRAVLGTIDLDPCSNPNSLVGARKSYTLPEANGLELPWLQGEVSTAYINPPFGTYYMNDLTKEIVATAEMKRRVESGKYADSYRAEFTRYTLKDWAKKIVSETESGLEAIVLVPAQPGTVAWGKYFHPHKNATCSLRGRIKFVGATAGAPMDCVCLYFGSKTLTFHDVFSGLGHVDLHR